MGFTTSRRGAPAFAAFGLAAALWFGPLGAHAAPVQPGTTSGRLDASDDRLEGGEYVDSYELSVRAGERYTIALESREFDAYLLVRGAGAHLDNDDANGTLNAEITHTFTQAGTASIGVTSVNAAEVGSYRLVIRREGGGNSTGAVATVDLSSRGNSTSPPPAAQAPSSAASVTLSPGRSVQGVLAQGDETLSSGEFTDRYTFNGTVGQRVRITMSSSAFDSYLMLRGDDTTQDNDDHRDGSLDAQIDTVLPYTGLYTVFATSVTPGERGNYSLRMENIGAPVAQAAPTRLTPGRAARGTLRSGDFQRQNGQFFDRFQFEGRAGQAVQIELTSSSFDTYLIVRGPDGGGEENDDISDSDRNSRVVYTLPTNGLYDVYVSSYSRGESGDYSITLGEVARPQASTSARATALALGAPQNGALQSGDGRLESGEFYDLYEAQLAAGQSYYISMTSTQVDTWLEIRQDGESLLSNDDEAPGSTNAGGVFTPRGSSPVQIIATTYASGETGAYTIALTSAAGAGTVRPAGDEATAAGAGRVFVLSVGISDYPGTGSDLQYCAEDAVKLRDAIRDARALAPESIVLTDRQATVENVRNAFRRVAQVVGPNDVFVFFFSGHGGQVRSADPTEIDGMDETLVFYDGSTTDNDFAALLNTVNARLQIIAIDACHAGGFARDVITRSNRLGIFSSEEDVLSLVADRFRAGGYLAHFLRGAFAGGADSDPRDGVITVGELTQSLRRDWATHMTNVRTETGTSEGTYQNLVIERAAKVSDVVIGARQAAR